MTRPLVIVIPLAAVVIASCGGAAGRAVRPSDPTAADALGEKECHDVSGASEPLVVDWKPEQRGDLELAMREGVAVVEYSCKGIKLLRDCKLDGSYGYMGVTRKEQVISLADSDEVKANLPLSGVALSAELKSGASLDVAMVMVGQQKTTWTSPTSTDLKGTCDGATHYVRGATVGAFALATSTSGSAKAVASFFGAEAGGASASKRDTKNKEGDLTSCKEASPKSTTPPDQCGSPIRLLIAPIAKAQKEPTAPPAKKKVELAEVDTACPKGLVLSEGKCTKAGNAKAYQCKGNDESECQTQCDKGNAGSCGSLGVLIAQKGSGDTRAAQMFQKGCKGDDSASCTNLGRLMKLGRGVTKNDEEAAKLFDKACLAGDALACGLLGEATAAGSGVPKDASLAASLFTQACSGGYNKSCTLAARAYQDGNGVSADKAKAAELFKKGCNGGDTVACVELGKSLEGSMGGANQMLAQMYFERGCNFGSAEACAERGRTELAQPVGGNADRAKGFFERACQWQNVLGCAAKKVLYGGTDNVFNDVRITQAWQNACNQGDSHACGRLGVVDVATGNVAGGK